MIRTIRFGAVALTCRRDPLYSQIQLSAIREVSCPSNRQSSAAPATRAAG